MNAPFSGLCPILFALRPYRVLSFAPCRWGSVARLNYFNLHSEMTLFAVFLILVVQL
jgi:hypothetical protein